MKKSPRDTVATLIELFPRAFMTKGHLCRPLKVGIHADVTERIGESPELKAALRFYTSSIAYLRTSTAGAVRVDLDGNAAGEVTEEAAQVAQERLVKATEKMQAAAWKAAWVKRAEWKQKKGNGKPAAAPSPQPAAPVARLSLAGLRAAAQMRKVAQG